MIDIFKIRSEKKDEGILLLPIIPDLYRLKEKVEKTNKNPLKHSVENWPQYNPQNLFALEGKMQERFKKILELSIQKMTENESGKENTITGKWLEQYYEKNLWTKFKSWVGSNFLLLIYCVNKDKIANRLTQSAIKWVLK